MFNFYHIHDIISLCLISMLNMMEWEIQQDHAIFKKNQRYPRLENAFQNQGSQILIISQIAKDVLYISSDQFAKYKRQSKYDVLFLRAMVTIYLLMENKSRILHGTTSLPRVFRYTMLRGFSQFTLNASSIWRSLLVMNIVNKTLNCAVS